MVPSSYLFNRLIVIQVKCQTGGLQPLRVKNNPVLKRLITPLLTIVLAGNKLLTIYQMLRGDLEFSLLD